MENGKRNPWLDVWKKLKIHRFTEKDVCLPLKRTQDRRKTQGPQNIGNLKTLRMLNTCNY